jgi:hypothetical protein
MTTHLGLLEIDCDAPPDAVVEACQRFGFRSPLDVRWYRRSRFLREHYPTRSLLSLRTWQELLGLVPTREPDCSCGYLLPELRGIAYLPRTGHETAYLLGQCRGCGTMFWDEIDDSEPRYDWAHDPDCARWQSVGGGDRRGGERAS